MPAPLARRTPTDVEPIARLVESARRHIAEGKAKSARRAYRSSFAGFDGWVHVATPSPSSGPTSG